MTIQYTNVGRDKHTWSKTYKATPSTRQIALEAKRGGRLISSGIDVEFDDNKKSGVIYVGRFRPVGTFIITDH